MAGPQRSSTCDGSGINVLIKTFAALPHGLCSGVVRTADPTPTTPTKSRCHTIASPKRLSRVDSPHPSPLPRGEGGSGDSEFHRRGLGEILHAHSTGEGAD